MKDASVYVVADDVGSSFSVSLHLSVDLYIWHDVLLAAYYTGGIFISILFGIGSAHIVGQFVSHETKFSGVVHIQMVSKYQVK